MRGIKHNDLWSMNRVDAPMLSPDGRTVAFVLRYPEVAGGRIDLCLLDPGCEGSARCLLTGPEAKTGVAWSPDSAQIAFVMTPAGEQVGQLYLISVDEGIPRRLTDVPSGVSAPRWRPDGRALLFESVCDSDAEPRGSRAASVRAYDITPVRWWNRWLDPRRPYPFVVELGSPNRVRNLLRGSAFTASAGFRGVFVTLPQATIETLQAQWAPDGASIVFAAHAEADELVRSRTGPAIFSLEVKGGEPVRLTPRGRSFTDPMFCRNGATLFALEKQWPDGYVQTDIVRLGPPGSSPQSLTPGWDRSVSSFVIAADEEYLYLNADDAGTQRIFRVARAGGAVTPVSQESDGTVRAFAALPDRVLALHETTTRAPEIITILLERRHRTRLTAFNDLRGSSVDAPPPRHFWFRSRRGADIHNLVFLPPRFDPSRKYPLITCIHGGPHVMAADNFYESWLNHHLLARPGYVVLATNYSGSTGFGRTFAESVEFNVLRLPAADIIEAAHAAAESFAFIDETRQAVVGGSYGGYLINWLLGETDHFKCAVVHAGAVNNLSQYGASDCGFDREIRMQSPAWAAQGQWLDQSPIARAERYSTPTLITHGELDYRVPVTESLTTFKLLQRRNVPSRLLVFPEEGHFIAKRANSRVLWLEIWRWLRRHLSQRI